MHDYAGCVHFHSAYSYDARVPLPRILNDAARVGLDFAILTDHFRLDARAEGFEGYFASPQPSPGGTIGPMRPWTDGPASSESKGCWGGRQSPGEAKSVLLIVGEEISPRYNHYLALNIQKPVVVWKTETHAQRLIDEVNAQGGFGFIAHPDHAGAPLVGSRAFPWIDWGVRGYAGLGLWDLMSDWNSALSTPWKTLLACLRPAHALKGPSVAALARWDKLTQNAHCAAIGEIDNHGHRRSFFGLTRDVFSFEFAFRTIRTHVLLEKPLTKNAPADAEMILSALRKGQSYVSLDIWNDPTGFSFRVYDDMAEAGPGGEFTRSGQALLEAKLPRPGRLCLIRNGRLIKDERRRAALQWDIDLPGVYRIEAHQRISGRWHPWIFSNPIWVK